MTGWLDEQWVGTELLPLLTHVFGHVDPASGKMWAVIVREVVSYIDFVVSGFIEVLCFRLTALSPFGRTSILLSSASVSFW